MSGDADEAALAELAQLLVQEEGEAATRKLIRDAMEEGYNSGEAMPEERIMEIQRAILLISSGEKTIPVHRISFLRTAWFRYAAAIIIICGLGTAIWYSGRSVKQPNAITDTTPVPASDVMPGMNGAVITLADGTQQELDSSSNKSIKLKDGRLLQLKDGRLLNEASVAVEKIEYNTITTPQGRQFHVQLPDGTNVWLNAASSIRYPTAFKGIDRKVSVTGEAYFEVAKNQNQPFVVDVDGRVDVQVLGTSFTINAYSDEPFISTTLLEGRIRLVGEPSLTSDILKPGQQAQTSISGTKVLEDADMKMATAWKDGTFQFNYTPVEDVLRQFARWYNVEVIYEKKAPAFKLTGTIKRDFTLSEALKTLELMGLHYRIEDRKLIIMN